MDCRQAPHSVMVDGSLSQPLMEHHVYVNVEEEEEEEEQKEEETQNDERCLSNTCYALSTSVGAIAMTLMAYVFIHRQRQIVDWDWEYCVRFFAAETAIFAACMVMNLVCLPLYTKSRSNCVKSIYNLFIIYVFIIAVPVSAKCFL